MTDGAGDRRNEPVLEARGVTRVLHETVPVTLVRDIRLSVAEGEFVSVTGPSGSGKSSLLYLLGLLDLPTEGQVLLEGRDTTGLDADTLAELRLAKLGFVFQFHFLLPEFTVLSNVMIPMQRLALRDDAKIKDEAMGLLDDLEIGDQANKHPDQLSGGQRQRVAIARALANDPSIVLADEPTGNLDSKNSDIVRDIFRRLTDEKGKTVVAVTHEEGFAAAADRNIHLVDGRIVNGA